MTLQTTGTMADAARRHSRRTVAASLAALPATMALAACSAGTRAEQRDSQTARTPATILLTTVFPDVPIVDVFKAQVQRFGAVAPHITVNFEPAASTADWLQKRKIEAAAGQSVDISHHKSASVVELAALGLLVDLNPYLKKDAKAIRFDDIWPDVAASGTYQGKQVGVFWRGVNVVVTVYHKGLFQAAGETTPDVLYTRGQWTWATVRDVARRLTNTQNPDRKIFGTHAFTLGNFQWATAALASFGAALLNDDRTRMTVNTPQGIECFEYFHTLVCKDGSAPQRSVDGNEFMPGGAVDQGRIAMAPTNLGAIVQRGFEWPYDIAPFPAGRQKASVLNAENIGILTHGKQKDAAWEYLKFAGSPEEQLQLQKPFGQVPVHKHQFDGWMTDIAARTKMQNVRFVRDVMQVAKEIPATTKNDDLQKVWQKYVFPMINECAGPSPRDVCDALSREGTQLLAQG